MARSEAPASAKAAGNSYPLCLPPPRQSSTLHESGQYPVNGPTSLRRNSTKTLSATPGRFTIGSLTLFVLGWLTFCDDSCFGFLGLRYA